MTNADVTLVRVALRRLAMFGSREELEIAIDADEAMRRLFPQPPAPPRPKIDKPPATEFRGI